MCLVGIQLSDFANATNHINDQKSKQMFYLYSLANGQPVASIPIALQLAFTDIDPVGARAKCAALYNIPNMTQWYVCIQIVAFWVSLCSFRCFFFLV